MNISFTEHAESRIIDRFHVSAEWLVRKLNEKQFVWVSGYGHDGADLNVRGAALVYIQDSDECCLAIIDMRNHNVVTVLTEEMAKRSSWSKGINDKAKLSAKQAMLGNNVVHDSLFLHLYSTHRSGTNLLIKVRTIDANWNPLSLTLSKLKFMPEQFDLVNNCARLTDSQENEVKTILLDKVTAREIHPFCEIFACTRTRNIKIVNKIDGFFDLEEAENHRRWFD